MKLIFNLRTHFFKYLSFFILILFLFSLGSCKLSDYKDTAGLIPSDSQITLNININSYFKQKGILGKINALKKLKALGTFFENMEELSGSLAFSLLPDENINFREELFPYIKPNFSLAFYNGGEILSRYFTEKILPFPEDMSLNPFLLVCNLKDKDEVEKFLYKLNDKTPYETKKYKDFDIFYSQERSYFIDEDFLILSNREELLQKSLDCYTDSTISLNNLPDFISFRENKMNSDSIGFVYYNVSEFTPELLEKIPAVSRVRWKELMDSVKYAGTSIEAYMSRAELNTYIVRKEELTPFGEKFFSLSERVLTSPGLFPEEGSNLFTLAEPGQSLPLIVSLLEGFPFMDQIKAKVENNLGMSLDYIFSSLSDEIGLSFYPEEVSNKEEVSYGRVLFSTSNVALKLREGSSLANILTGSDSLFSILSVIIQTGEEYRDITINSVPGGRATYAKVGDFYLLGLGNSKIHTEAVIDTYYGDNKSIEDKINSEISTEAVGLSYLNMEELYIRVFMLQIKDEELRKDLEKFFQEYPELWGSLNTAEDGYVVTSIVPID